MDSNPEEVMGCFLGMAVGDAMGRAVKGLKPEAIRQIFGTIADYKDCLLYTSPSPRDS